MTLYLIRHAKAGDRLNDHAADRDRSLSKTGRAQAVQIAEILRTAGISRIISSPFKRCVETVSPLAEKLGLRVEPSETLAEETSLAALSTLIESLGSTQENAALCSHGNVIPAVLRLLGVYSHDTMLCQKGSIYTVDLATGQVVYAQTSS